EGTSEGKCQRARPSFSINVSNSGFSLMVLAVGSTPIGKGATTTFGSLIGKLIVRAVKRVSEVNRKKASRKAPYTQRVTKVRREFRRGRRKIRRQRRLILQGNLVGRRNLKRRLILLILYQVNRRINLAIVF